MKISSLPITKTFKLKSDPDGTAQVTIRQATFGDNQARAQVFKQQVFIFNDAVRGEVKQEQQWSYAELQAMEIMLTLVDASGIQDENGNELFEFREGRVKSQAHFSRVLALLPVQVVREIHEYVRQMNPDWGTGDDSEGE